MSDKRLLTEALAVCNLRLISYSKSRNKIVFRVHFMDMFNCKMDDDEILEEIQKKISNASDLIDNEDAHNNKFTILLNADNIQE